MTQFAPFSAILIIGIDVGLSVHDIVDNLTDEELMTILDGEKIYL